mgnify:CR=1 FL=1
MDVELTKDEYVIFDLETNKIIEKKLPQESDYGALLDEEGVIISLSLPVNEYIVRKDKIENIIINETIYDESLSEMVKKW